MSLFQSEKTDASGHRFIRLSQGMIMKVSNIMTLVAARAGQAYSSLIPEVYFSGVA